jgi:integrase/recombinase XerC
MKDGIDAPTIAQLLKAYLTRENTGTVRNYESVLEDFRRYTKSASPEAAIANLISSGPSAANDQVANYKRAMTGMRDKNGKLTRGRGLSSAAVNLRLTVLRSIMKKARQLGIIQWELDTSNIVDERVHDVRGPEPDLLNRMLLAAKARPGAEGRRDYAIMRLAAELGLRRREITGLDMADFSADACEVRIKGKRRREKETLACSPKTAEAIECWIEVCPRAEGAPLFTNLIPGRASRISGPAVYLIVRGLGKEALPSKSSRKIGPHKIRHSAITSAVRLAKANGLAREEVQKFSRHKDFRMVSRYLDADDRAQEILARANGANLQ